MKLIHCADLHLDSKMETNLTKEQARERKAELLNTFQRMVEFASEQHVTAILIAGDLFDKKNVSATAKSIVCQMIQFHPEIDFYYLRGNHDEGSLFQDMEHIPENLKLFSDTWKTYRISSEQGMEVAISGVEPGASESSIYEGLVLNPSVFNIVMLHGQESLYQSKEKAAMIPLGALRNKGIDYLALGHIHGYREDRLDSRGVYCYSGCLEGRGFDECGEHGIVLLDISEETGKAKRSFIPMASRNFYSLEVDVTGCYTTLELQKCIEEALEEANYSSKSFVKLILVGEYDVECEKNLTYLQKKLEQQFYFLKIQDNTKLRVDYDSFALDVSLKGEFVRVVQEDASLSEEERAAIIRFGIQALAGEGEWE